MIIVAGGDSFVYGSELADCTAIQHSNSTFPALLAQTNDYEYRCIAWPGYGNDSIARTVINYCEKNKQHDIFVVVSWTFPGRYEFRFTYDTGQRTENWCAITPWTIADDTDVFLRDFKNNNDVELKGHQIHLERAKKTGTYDFAKTFYKHVGSSGYWEIYSSLKEIVYLQNYLKVNRIGYLFTCASTDLFLNYTLENKEEYCTNLHKQIDFDYWFIFSNTTPLGFYQWADFNKYPIGVTHPLEQAHRDAADLMKEKFNELVKTYLE